MNFQQAVFMILDEGQKLSGAEKSIVNEIVAVFIIDYIKATKREPQPIFDDLILISGRLQSLGFEIPRVDRWFEEDMFTIRRYAEIQGVKRMGKEREGD